MSLLLNVISSPLHYRPGMLPRLDLITVAVNDLDVARAFYLDGLGWPAALEVPGEIVFLQLNHGLLLGLFPADQLAEDVGVDAASVRPGVGFTLAHNVSGPDEVDDALERAVACGARIVKPAQRAAFGGYHGYFADPDGIRWEVAHNPGWRVDPDGTVRIGVID